MGSAILTAAIGDKGTVFEPRDTYAFDPDREKLSPLKLRGVNICGSAKELVKASDILILAVKPQIMAEVLSDIAGQTVGRCVVSIAAGIRVEFIRSRLPHGTHVLRVMPNAPILFGSGATVIANPENVPDSLVACVKAVFEAAGIAVMMDESKLDAATAISGSSPAYFYRMADVMARYAQEQGIDRDTALILTAKTMMGSALALLESGLSPQRLTSAVTSPGGTTLAALGALDELGFDDTLRTALLRCQKRAQELSGA